MIVETYDSRKIYTMISKAVNEKIIHLSEGKELADFIPNTYTRKSAKNRCCISCGKDILNQHQSSRFCSAEFVGEREAHRCRNRLSNQSVNPGKADPRSPFQTDPLKTNFKRSQKKAC